ncbi:hypothetical protein Z945_2259 [Sulfitobacter noctilucae]|uniref:GNAT family N-acetyltransferase n=1 Tax=Sulfitobacter noctilucae TaxID=1342302 RepID=UPI000468DC81|nr:GNAT family N-acetyltransferase [Sulfitobacter noctilucae]KIN61269.1 hypothetical protein Z945_2259 [Sulfitobacter noctilucae]
MFDVARLPDRALMQDPAFARALQLCGQEPLHLPCGLMLLQRRIAGVRVLMLPRAIPPPDLPNQLAAISLQRCPVILSPDTPCALPRSLPVLQPREVCVLSLTGSKAGSRARMHPKWRNQLRRAETFDLTVTRTPLEANPDGEVLALESNQAKQRGYANWPPPLTAAFAAAAPAQTHVFRASHAGRSIAHMVFFTHGTAATYHLGHITTQGRRFCAHNLLLWRAGQYLAHEGYRELHLGVLDNRTPGLDRFKLRSGGLRRNTGGTHLYWAPFARR